MDARCDRGDDAPHLPPGEQGAVRLQVSSQEQALQRLQTLLQPGDLIFIARRGWLSRQVARATGSWISDVGLCLRDGAGRWVVYEAAVPMVRRVSLARFIRATRGNRFAVLRLRPQPCGEALQRLEEAAQRRIGCYNALGFDLDSRQLFCAKLIHEVFNEAMGVKLGKVTTLGDLQHQLPARTLRFWRFWYLGAIPWQRRTITPHSQYTDPGLETVLESF